MDACRTVFHITTATDTAQAGEPKQRSMRSELTEARLRSSRHLRLSYLHLVGESRKLLQ